MEKDIKLTEEIIKELIDEEINNLSEEDLQEQGWWSTIKGIGSEMAQDVKQYAVAAGAKGRAKDFFKGYYKIVDDAANNLNKAAEEMADKAHQASLQPEEQEMVSSLDTELRKISKEVMGSLTQLLEIGMEKGYYDPSKEAVGKVGLGTQAFLDKETSKTKAQAEKEKKKKEPSGVAAGIGGFLRGLGKQKE